MIRFKAALLQVPCNKLANNTKTLLRTIRPQNFFKIKNKTMEPVLTSFRELLGT